jgi:hypothetical protein
LCLLAFLLGLELHKHLTSEIYSISMFSYAKCQRRLSLYLANAAFLKARTGHFKAHHIAIFVALIANVLNNF